MMARRMPWDEGKRHDGVELLVVLPPHAASRLPESVTSEYGRADVMPSLNAPDNGMAIVIDVDAARAAFDIRNIRLKDVLR